MKNKKEMKSTKKLLLIGFSIFIIAIAGFVIAQTSELEIELNDLEIGGNLNE